MLRRFGFLVVSIAVGCASESTAVPDREDSGTTEDAPSTTDGGVEADAKPGETPTTDAPAGDADPCASSKVGCDSTRGFHPRIRAYFDAHGGKAQLGDVADNGGGVWVHPWGAGRTQDFAGGSGGPVVVAESDSTAAWAKSAYGVRGAIRDRWLALGGGPVFGFPIEDEHAGPGGAVQTFEKGCIGPDGTGGYDARSACDAPGDLSATLDKIGTMATGFAAGTQAALGVEWLPTGERWAFHGDEPHVSASSMKLVWAMAALAKNSIATVTTPALPTFKDSNNSTAGQLIDLAGGADAVNVFTRDGLGIPVDQLSLCHWNFDATRDGSATCSGAMSGNNFFTPNSALSVLVHAWKRDVVAGDKGAKLLEWATLSPRTGYGGWLGTQLPPDAQKTMHHKAGWLPPGCCSSDSAYNNMNEIGIVHTPRGAYAITLMFAHAPDYWGAQQKALEWSSCVVFHALARDVADPFAAGCATP